MADLLQQLQRDSHARVDSDPAFYYVPVLLNRPRDAAGALQIRDALDKALMGLRKKNGKAGLAVMVMLPDAEVPAENLPGPMFDVLVTFRVLENPIFNEGDHGTGISAEQCALNILGLCHLWNPGTGTVYAAKKALRDAAVPEGCIGYDVVLKQHIGLQPRSAVLRPLMTVDGGMLTLSCPTPGAAIYWTHDGGLPTPGQGTVYDGQVDVSALTGQWLRAVAYKDGMAASDGVLKQV